MNVYYTSKLSDNHFEGPLLLSAMKSHKTTSHDNPEAAFALQLGCLGGPTSSRKAKKRTPPSDADRFGDLSAEQNKDFDYGLTRTKSNDASHQLGASNVPLSGIVAPFTHVSSYIQGNLS